MRLTARRFAVFTLVLFAFGFASVQAREVSSQEPAEEIGPFLRVAKADRQATAALSTAVSTGMPRGLSGSAAVMTSESVRAQLLVPMMLGAATPRPRTVVVREGQSVWDIATAWGVSVRSIVAANRLGNARYLKTGQTLVIPVTAATAAPVKRAQPARSVVTRSTARATAPKVRAKVSHAQPRSRTARPVAVTLGEGQTLWSLARAHGVSVEAIARANGLRNADMVRAGRRLVIPGRTTSSPTRALTVRTRAQRSGDTYTKAASTAIRIARGFLWPARGQLTSRFGWRRWRHHDGIDIAAPYGSPIYAARPGRVVFAGWYYAYGRAVIVDHGNGLQTLYGHASTLLVGVGQTVGQGALIARVGSSGRATGPHVHFEVRVNGKAVNPMRYMN